MSTLAVKKRFQVNWRYRGQKDVLFLDETITVEPYTFEKSDIEEVKKHENITDIAINGQEPKIPPRPYNKISWIMEIEKENKVIDESEKVVDLLLKVLTIKTDESFEYHASDYYKITEDEKIQAGLVLPISVTHLEKPRKIEKKTIKETVELYKKINALNEKSKEIITRAIEWYDRAIKEKDKINAYANYWICFESLSTIIGKGEPWTCQKCGVQIQEESISKRIQVFLDKLGFEDFWRLSGKELYGIRNSLFHRSQTDFEGGKLEELKKILRRCIIKSVELKTNK